MNALVFENDQHQLLFNVGLKTALVHSLEMRAIPILAYYLDLSYHIQGSIPKIFLLMQVSF